MKAQRCCLLHQVRTGVNLVHLPCALAVIFLAISKTGKEVLAPGTGRCK